MTQLTPGITPEEIISLQVHPQGGVIKDEVDLRDFKAEELMGSALDIPVDWDKGYDALADCWPDMPNQNQESQFSCVGRACSAYKQVLQCKDTGEKTLLSAKSVYNPIAIPHTGTYVRSGMVRTVNYGVNKEATVPSNGTEDQVCAKFDFAPFASEADFYKNLTVAAVDTQNFDTLAKMILLNHGFVSGWETHCQYVKGFGKLNGRRYLKTHGSYGPNSDMYHFEGDPSPLFSAWTAIDVKNLAPVLDNGLLNHDVVFGQTGADVLLARRLLQKVGWTNNVASNVYDTELATVVLNFQKANLLPAWLSSSFKSVLALLLNYQGKSVSGATRATLNRVASIR